MRDYREISRLMERTVHKYIQLEKQPRNYGGITLTQTEVHTIAVIGDFPDINVTRLAAVRGITKGATSQMIHKLVDKALVIKETSPNTDAEVCLNLTELGKRVYEEHYQYHDKSGSDFFKALEYMPEKYEEYLAKMLYQFDEALDKRLK